MVFKMVRNRRGPSKLTFRGKPLHVLLEKLPANGVGRLIIRGSTRQVPGEPSYMRILSVDMTRYKSKKKLNVKHADSIRIVVIVERTYRGFTNPKPVNICSTSHLSDFMLVPKAEESKYLENRVPAFNKKNFLYTSSQKRRIKEMILSGMRPSEAKRIEREKALKEDVEERKRFPDEQYNEDEDDENEIDSEDPQEFENEVENSEANNEGKQLKAESTRSAQDSSRQTKNRRSNENTARNRVKSPEKNLNSWCEEEAFGDFTEEQTHRINNMVTQGMNADTAKQIEWERDQAFKSAAANELTEEKNTSDLKRPHSKNRSTNDTDGENKKLAKVN